MRGGKVVEKPTVTLCGFGSNLCAEGYCHGRAHHRMLHFRNNGGVMEFAEFEEPTDYLTALREGEWRPVVTGFGEWVC